MSLSDIVESWGAVEADFNRFYNVTNPLELTWRKFNILLFNLISEQSAFFRPFMDEAREIAEMEAEWESKKRGDRANIPREQVSLDKALGEIGISGE
jgi:hypothetical protein|tara:strand:- start:160 stop:450 length:291 start_codon:yes stop_codon:yes gene_type:complete